MALEREGNGGEQGVGWDPFLIEYRACLCYSSAGSLHAPAPLLYYQEQVCGTNESLQVLFLNRDFAFLSFLTGQRKFHSFKLVLIVFPR